MTPHPPLCIYHANCDDGFGAAWVLHAALSDAEFHAAHYQTPPPDVTDRDVYLVDFSYKLPVLQEMLGKAESITILDHHKTAEEDLRTVLMGKHAAGVFDMDRSGAMITWDWFFPEQAPPLLLRYIQDRDLWHKNLPHCDAVIAWLRSYPQSFDMWAALADKLEVNFDGVVKEGNAILRSHEAQRQQALRHAHDLDTGVFTCRATHTTIHFSEVATELAGPDGVGAAYFMIDGGKSVVFSLRSQETGPDVSEIAKRFGGGGHKHAAGFKISAPNFGMIALGVPIDLDKLVEETVQTLAKEGVAH